MTCCSLSPLHYRVISIDFTKMRVLKKKNIKVRRMSAKDTEWLWYYRGDHCWYQYGEKVSFTLMDMVKKKHDGLLLSQIKDESVSYCLRFYKYKSI